VWGRVCDKSWLTEAHTLGHWCFSCSTLKATNYTCIVYMVNMCYSVVFLYWYKSSNWSTYPRSLLPQLFPLHNTTCVIFACNIIYLAHHINHSCNCIQYKASSNNLICTQCNLRVYRDYESRSWGTYQRSLMPQLFHLKFINHTRIVYVYAILCCKHCLYWVYITIYFVACKSCPRVCASVIQLISQTRTHFFLTDLKHNELGWY
jgi:hypothetical protein